MIPATESMHHETHENAQGERVASHLPLVYSIAQRVAKIAPLGTLEVNDLINAGVLGLYKAAEKYDEAATNTFATYAAHFIRGAILDELNQHQQRPRGIRDKAKKVKEAQSTLAQRLMREPTDDEVANYLGISTDTYGRWLVDLGFTSIYSLDELESGGEVYVPDESVDSNPEKTIDKMEFQVQLASALGQLASRDQQILYLYYEEELTLKEISYIMNLSESQISRIHAKTILYLRRILET